MYNESMEIIEKLEGKKIDLVLNKVMEGDDKKGYVPALLYKMVLHNTNEVVGFCDARIGYNENIYYGGHIGYSVREEYRGNGYAVEAVELLKKVFKANDMRWIYITNNPDNHPSIRVCEKAGARFVKLVELPEYNEQRVEMGELFKNIWELKF